MYMEIIPTFKVEWNRSPLYEGYSFRVSREELEAFVKVLLFNGIKNITITDERDTIGE